MTAAADPTIPGKTKLLNVVKNEPYFVILYKNLNLYNAHVLVEQWNKAVFEEKNFT